MEGIQIKQADITHDPLRYSPTRHYNSGKEVFLFIPLYWKRLFPYLFSLLIRLNWDEGSFRRQTVA